MVRGLKLQDLWRFCIKVAHLQVDRRVILCATPGSPIAANRWSWAHAVPRRRPIWRIFAGACSLIPNTAIIAANRRIAVLSVVAGSVDFVGARLSAVVEVGSAGVVAFVLVFGSGVSGSSVSGPGVSCSEVSKSSISSSGPRAFPRMRLMALE